MVRLGDRLCTLLFEKFHCFNSTMVRLGVYSNPETERMMSSFNSTMVRLGAF